MSEAACRGVDPKVFFGVNARAAKVICARCPVLGDCRAWNDEIETLGIGARGGVSALAGVYAAETPKERVARRRREGDSDPPPRPVS